MRKILPLLLLEVPLVLGFCRPSNFDHGSRVPHRRVDSDHLYSNKNEYLEGMYVGNSDLDDSDIPSDIASIIAKSRKMVEEGEDMEDDDELLYNGLYNEQETKKEQDTAQETEQEIDQEKVADTETTVNESDLESMYSDWTDFDQIPDLKTVVPETDSNESTGDQGDVEGKKGKPGVVDYMENYDDENELHIPNRLGISTRRWGDASQGFVPGKPKLTKRMKRAGKFGVGDCRKVYNSLLEAGIFFMETSETYGMASRNDGWSAEDIIKNCVSKNKEFEGPLLASTYGGKVLARGIQSSVEGSCDRLGQTSLELYQSGWRLGLGKKLLEALEDGSCIHVGVINYSQSAMEKLSTFLEMNDYSLTSNQFEFSLTNRKADKSGLLDACKSLGVIPLIRNPLDTNDLASGRFTATNPSGGIAASPRGPFPLKRLEKLQPLHAIQESLAERVGLRVRREFRRRGSKRDRDQQAEKEVTTTQIAINYVVAKGGVPLVDVYNAETAEMLKGCLGWSLTEDEVEALDRAADLSDL